MTQAQERAKIIVVLEWLGFIVGEVILLGIFIYFWANFDSIVDAIVQQDPKVQYEDAVAGVKFIMICIGVGILLVGIFQGAINTVLHKGVHQGKGSFLKFWVVFQFVFFVFAILGAILNMIDVVNGNLTWYYFIINLISLAYRGISIKLVKDFKDEVLSSGGHVYSTA